MQRIVSSSIVETKIGLIFITASDEMVLGVHFIKEKVPVRENHLTKAVKKELLEYFAGTRTAFSIFPLALTDLEKKIFEQVMMIPYGTTKTYYQIAKSVGNPKAVSTVANTLATNPYLILVPCHRVILKNGSLYRYRAGLKRKEYLLKFEQRKKDRNEKNSTRRK